MIICDAVLNFCTAFHCAYFMASKNENLFSLKDTEMAHLILFYRHSCITHILILYTFYVTYNKNGSLLFRMRVEIYAEAARSPREAV